MVYLGEGCLGVVGHGVWSFDVCYLGELCLGEGTEREREVPGVTAMELGKPSEHLSQGKMSTVVGKERVVAAGHAGETAACLESTMRLQDFV